MNHNARVQRWLAFLTAFNYTFEYRKDSPNGDADLLFRLPKPAMEHDRSGLKSLKPVEDGGIYLIRACGLSDMFDVTIDELTARGTANVLVNPYISLWKVPTHHTPGQRVSVMLQAFTSCLQVFGRTQACHELLSPQGQRRR